MLFSRSTEYAIRAMVYLSSLKAGELAGAREISEAESIPMPFLWKILHMLARQRLVRSFKGLHGGYELAVGAERVSLSTIVSVADGNEFRDRCVLGLPECSSRHPCPLHEQWKGIRTDLACMLDQTSLADLAQVTRKKAPRKRK